MKCPSTIELFAYATCIGYCICAVLLGETTQVTVSKFHYPFILRWINTVTQILALPLIPVWKCYRSKFNHPTNIIKPQATPSKYFKNNHYADSYIWFMYYSLGSCITASVSGILINISLQHITVPTSSAISGMRPVAVLLMSIFLINEQLTLWKISAMIFAIIGVLLFVLELKSHSIHHGQTHDTFLGIFLTIAWTVG